MKFVVFENSETHLAKAIGLIYLREANVSKNVNVTFYDDILIENQRQRESEVEYSEALRTERKGKNFNSVPVNVNSQTHSIDTVEAGHWRTRR